MRVVASLIICALGAAAASAMPPADDMLGNFTALKDSPSIAGRPDAAQAQTPPAADQSEGKPELVAIMDRIEATRRMPANASPVATYARYYAWADAAKTKVTAIYVSLGGAAPGRRWVDFDELPLIDDGGCGVVELIYDVKTGVIEDVYCNGIA